MPTLTVRILQNISGDLLRKVYIHSAELIKIVLSINDIVLMVMNE